MVAKTVSVLDGLAVPVERRQAVLTMASVAEKEVSFAEEYPKVARVIENRLDRQIPLGIDTINAYGLGKPAIELVGSDFDIDNPYNSRLHLGLPPTPISNPGEASIAGALNPADGPWVYFVTVDLDTGETIFTDSYDEFLAGKARFRAVARGDQLTAPSRAAVLGHPVQHSLSPVLHRAAYRALGLDDWRYDALDVTSEGLPEVLRGLDDTWAGLSLTMPLKQTVIPLLDHVEPLAEVVGAVNTVLVQHAPGPSGARRRQHRRARARGGAPGAAGHPSRAADRRRDRRRGDRRVDARRARPARLHDAVGAPAGDRRAPARSSVRRTGWAWSRGTPGWTSAADAVAHADVVVSTVPAHAADGLAAELAGRRVRGVLLDVVYDPRPTALSVAWAAAGGAVVGGERMLLHQAVEQVRLMTGRVAPLAAMDAALRAAPRAPDRGPERRPRFPHGSTGGRGR